MDYKNVYLDVDHMRIQAEIRLKRGMVDIYAFEQFIDECEMFLNGILIQAWG